MQRYTKIYWKTGAILEKPEPNKTNAVITSNKAKKVSAMKMETVKKNEK